MFKFNSFFRSATLSLLLFIVLACCLSCERQQTVHISKELNDLGAKCGYYQNSTFSKQIFSIYYVDAKNFHEILPILGRIESPFSLSVSLSKVNKSDMEILASLSKMEILDFVDCEFIPDAKIISELSNNVYLKEIGIGGHRDKQEAVKEAFNVPQIESLRLIGCVIDHNEIERLPQLTLRNLDMAGSILDGECLSIISKCNTLKNVSFFMAQLKDSEKVSLLQNLPNLETLDVSKCVFSSSVLKGFIGHPKLKQLIVQDTVFTSEDIDLLSQINHIGVPAVLAHEALSTTKVPEPDQDSMKTELENQKSIDSLENIVYIIGTFGYQYDGWQIAMTFSPASQKRAVFSEVRTRMNYCARMKTGRSVTTSARLVT